MGSHTMPKIPTIDFSKEDLKPGTKTWLSTCKEVCYALEECGCFIVESSKVSLDLHNTIFGTIQELYDLSTEVKKLNITDKPFRGYFSANPVHEGMGIDNATTLEGTQKFTNLMWPNGNDRFSESSHNIAMITMELDQMVTRMVFEHYGVEKHYDSHIGLMDYVLRFSKYKETEKNESNLGLPSHTDKTFSTILHQDNVNGLEIQTKDGEWIVFDPSSHSSFLYTAGDAFKVWSNNRINSCYHRVIMNGNKERYSLGLFTFNKGVIHIPEELVDNKYPLRYKPFDHLGYLKLLTTKAAQKVLYPVEDYCGV